MKDKIAQKLIEQRLVAIIRVSDSSEIPGIVRCLIAGGVCAVEITSNTRGWQESIAGLRRKYPDLLIGAGTITSVNLADEAAAAGAQFLVTPNTRAEVVTRAHGHGLPVIMGAMTPSEIVEATEAGADIIKLFPAAALGPAFLKALAGGPFRDTVFFAVGGIDEHNLGTWMNSGAAGVGIGGSLAASVVTQTDAERLIERVSLIVHQLKH